MPSNKWLTADDGINAVRLRLVGKLVRQFGSVHLVEKVTTRADHYGPDGDSGQYSEDDWLVMHRSNRDGGWTRNYISRNDLEVWGES